MSHKQQKPATCPLYSMKTGSQRSFGILCQYNTIQWSRTIKDAKDQRDTHFDSHCCSNYQTCKEYNSQIDKLSCDKNDLRFIVANGMTRGKAAYESLKDPGIIKDPEEFLNIDDKPVLYPQCDTCSCPFHGCLGDNTCKLENVKKSAPHLIKDYGLEVLKYCKRPASYYNFHKANKVK